MNDPTTEGLLKLTTGPASKRTDGVSLWIYLEVMRTDAVCMWIYMKVMLPEPAKKHGSITGIGRLPTRHRTCVMARFHLRDSGLKGSLGSTREPAIQTTESEKRLWPNS